jgi:2,4-dienoyl-CoA reductase-like NADH-dependent reductase (Old Yellow Enzyme family)
MNDGTLFDPVRLCGLSLRNRFVMSPMTRSKSPGGVPGEHVAAYYRRRAEGGAGLVITEGAWIPHPSAWNTADVPHLYGDEALAGWSKVVAAVHGAGGMIFPQLWHAGSIEDHLNGTHSPDPKIEVGRQVSPSGMAGGAGKGPHKMGQPLRDEEIADIVLAFGAAAGNAMRLGFDGIEVHGAHGYLIDQFLWHETNLRDDRYGGSIENRTRFAVEVIAECRRRTAPNFPIFLRMSQWKLHNFDARLAQTPAELERLIGPLAEAGVDLFDCSTRLYTNPEFEGSDLNLAGWVKKLSGRLTMTVGSVGLRPDLQVAGIEQLERMFERGDFDLVAVGRSLLADPQWVEKMRDRQTDQIRIFDRSSMLPNLY